LQFRVIEITPVRLGRRVMIPIEATDGLLEKGPIPALK
jgi:hypothetical protein